jgi:fido (protein-threonine AMPylation protein)
VSLFATGDGNTPLSPEEQDDLIPDLTTKEELNEWEHQNILEAYGWAFAPRTLHRRELFAESYVRELHRRMFDQTWKWAGRYRSAEKNIGIAHYQIRTHLRLCWAMFATGSSMKHSHWTNSRCGFIIASSGFIHSQMVMAVTPG